MSQSGVTGESTGLTGGESEASERFEKDSLAIREKSVPAAVPGESCQPKVDSSSNGQPPNITGLVSPLS